MQVSSVSVSNVSVNSLSAYKTKSILLPVTILREGWGGHGPHRLLLGPCLPPQFFQFPAHARLVDIIQQITFGQQYFKR